MSLPAGLPNALIETVLGQLTLLFLAGANGDPQAARHAALALLTAYEPRTELELTLTADIVNFGSHALQSLRQAAEPDLPLNQVMRLRGIAVRLSREAHHALAALEKSQQARRAAQEQFAPEQAQSVAAQRDAVAPAEPAVDPVEAPRPSATPSYAHLSKEAIRRLSPKEQKRIYLEQMTQNMRRRQAEQAALAAQRNAVAPASPAG